MCENGSFIQLFCAYPKMIARAREVKVKTQAFCDEAVVHIDTIGTTKSGDSFRPDQILHRSEEQTVEKLECWAARDGRASEAADLQKVFVLWNEYARDTKFIIHCKSKTYDDDISKSTDLLAMYPKSAGHYKKDLPGTPFCTSQNEGCRI
jgi:hypothetical protein